LKSFYAKNRYTIEDHEKLWTSIGETCGDELRKSKKAGKVKVVHLEKRITENDLVFHTQNLQFPCLFRCKEKYLVNPVIGKRVTVIDKNSDISEITKEQLNREEFDIFAQKSPISKEEIAQLPFSKRVYASNIFHTRKGRVTGIHNEIGETMNFQISGRKQWTLVDPVNSHYVFPFRMTPYTNGSIFAYNLIPNSIPRYVIKTRPGDVLYVPSWWWHQVESLTDAVSLSRRLFINCHHEIFFPSILKSACIKYIAKEFLIRKKYIKGANNVILKGITRCKDLIEIGEGYIKKYFTV